MVFDSTNANDGRSKIFVVLKEYISMNPEILIITSDFLPIPSANGVCAYNLAKAFLDKKYSVSVICNRQPNHKKHEIIDAINVYRIYDKYLTINIKNIKLKTFIDRLNLLIHIYIFPLTSIISLVRYVHTTFSLVNKYDIKLLVAFNNPLVACLSGVIAKIKYKNDLRFVVYDVDSFSNTLAGRFLGKAQKKRMMKKWERLVFNTTDQLIIMRNHENHYKQVEYMKYRNIMKVSNFPMLCLNKQEKESISNDSELISCIYLGTLSKTYRNPIVLCEVFSNLKNTKVHFYGRIDDSEIISRFSDITNERIIHRGLISFEEGQKKLNMADILISLGNRDSDMVPSKTFEYISYCKPIIHFYTFEGDPVIPVLEKYPLALLLNSNRPINELVEKTAIFIKSAYGKRISTTLVRQLFIENTPEFSVELIEGNF
jgi:hypothetical protein